MNIRFSESYSSTNLYYLCSHARLVSTSNSTPKSEELKLFDVDCNLNHPALKNNALEYLKEASNVNIVRWAVPGSDIKSSFDSLNLGNKMQAHGFDIVSTIGVHPFCVSSQEKTMTVEDAIHLMREKAPQFSAIGECGLDFSDGFPEQRIQMRWFVAQLNLARSLNIPLFLHERLASKYVFKLLQEAKDHGDLPPVLVHCFTGNAYELDSYLKLGCYVSFSGLICRINAGANLRDAIKSVDIPLDKVMIETDAPYLGFPGCRKATLINRSTVKITDKSIFPNVPNSLPMILKSLSEILEMRPDQLGNTTTKNANVFFLKK